MLSLPSLFSLVFLVFQRETSQEEAIRKIRLRLVTGIILKNLSSCYGRFCNRNTIYFSHLFQRGHQINILKNILVVYCH